jgi:hypothetical protein
VTPLTHTFELASFTVRNGEQEALIAERPAMIAALEHRFPGFIAAWLTREDDESWLDIVLWRTRTDAKKAAEEINDVPEARAWFRHIAESRGVRHVEVVHEQEVVTIGSSLGHAPRGRTRTP